MAPDTVVKSKETTKGAIFTTIGWILSTEIYSFYVSYFARYNLLYGSVANLLILFLWIYLLSYIFMLGMALNVSSREEIEIENK
jgi:membrane protein